MHNDTCGLQTDAIHAGEAEHASSTPISLGEAASLVHDARSENRIRMSVGLEDCADIERDLEQAIG